MRRLWVSLAMVLLVLPSAAQDEDHGLSAIWSQVLRDPLKALPLENPETYNTTILRLDRIASGFDRSQRSLGDEHSGPLLRRIAPHAADVAGVSLSAPNVRSFLASADAYRAGTHPDPAQARAALMDIKAVLDRTNASAQQFADSAAAWKEAYAWWLALWQLDGAAAPPTVLPSLTIGGDLWPGGRMDILVRDLQVQGTLVLPWKQAQVPAGPRILREPIPFTQPLGDIEMVLRYGSAQVSAPATIGPIPLQLGISGPREVLPGSTNAYTITTHSPVPLDRPALLQAFVDGQEVTVSSQSFQAKAPESGSFKVRAAGGPGLPWKDAEGEIEVRVVAQIEAPEGLHEGLHKAGILSASGGLGATAWLLLLLLLLLAAWLAYRFLRERRATGPATAALAPPMLDRLRQWWSTPDRYVARDFRRAARLLADSGDVGPGATHKEVAMALQRKGLSERTASRLAHAYERYWYAADPTAPRHYWKARGRT